MSEEFPLIYLATHGEIAWSLTRRNMVLTDLPLTEAGGRYAFRLQLAHTLMLESTGHVPECSPDTDEPDDPSNNPCPVVLGRPGIKRGMARTAVGRRRKWSKIAAKAAKVRWGPKE